MATQKSKLIKFRTKILGSGKNTAGIVVPPEKVEELGQGKRVPVEVSLNGFSYRSTIAVMGGKYCIGVSNDIRQASGLKVNDNVDVVLKVDDKPRVVRLPDELVKLLMKNPDTSEFFSSLSYSNKLRFALQIETAKTPETLKKRIENILKHLKAKTKI